MKKRLLSLALAAALCLGLAVPAFAAESPVIHWLETDGYVNFLEYVEELDAFISDEGLVFDRNGRFLRDISSPDWDSGFEFSEGLAAAWREEESGIMRFGYIDYNGNLVIPLIYDSTDSFSEGLARVIWREWQGNDWTDPSLLATGYIDKAGNVVIPFEYGIQWNYLMGFDGDFYDGLAIVEVDQTFGLIDRNNRAVTPLAYTQIYPFSDGLALMSRDAEPDWVDGMGVVWIGKCGYLDKNGKEVVAPVYDLATSFSGGRALVGQTAGQDEDGYQHYKVGVIDATGAVVVPMEYQADTLGEISEGIAAVGRISGWDDGYGMPVFQWGFLDTAGREVAAPQYGRVESFSEGMALVYRGDWNHSEGKYGFIDRSGKEVIPCRYEYADSFSGGLAVVYEGEGFDQTAGCIDRAGNVVLPVQYESVRLIADGRFGFVSDGNRTGIFENPLFSGGGGLAYASTQNILVDGRPVEFQAYALKDEDGNDTNYIKLRDVAYVLSLTQARFSVGWDQTAGAISVTSGQPYQPTGTEMSTPYSGNRSYEISGAPLFVNGQSVQLEAILLTDDAGNGYTYFKLRDLGAALGFTVGWSQEQGIYIETK